MRLPGAPARESVVVRLPDLRYSSDTPVTTFASRATPMTKASYYRFAGIGALLALASTIAVLAQQTGPAATESVFSQVDECDVLAAHPDDARRLADGLEDDEMVPRLARMACERAVQRFPNEPRFTFQLGRALLTEGRRAEATPQFRRAADRGYAAAIAFLGNAYQFGWGVPVDTAAARGLYTKATAAGFEAADDIVEALTFDARIFVARTFLGSLYQGDREALARESADPKVRNHALNFVLALIDECGPVVQPETIPGLYLYRFPPGVDPDAEESIAVTIQESIGKYDAARFIARYGCDGPVAVQMVDRIRDFFTRR